MVWSKWVTVTWTLTHPYNMIPRNKYLRHDIRSYLRQDWLVCAYQKTRTQMQWWSWSRHRWILNHIYPFPVVSQAQEHGTTNKIPNMKNNLIWAEQSPAINGIFLNLHHQNNNKFSQNKLNKTSKAQPEQWSRNRRPVKSPPLKTQKNGKKPK